MNRVKTLLTAGLLLALAFTVSCSDDDKGDDDGKSSPSSSPSGTSSPSGGGEKWCVIGVAPYQMCIKIGVAHPSAYNASLATENGCSTTRYAEVVDGPINREDCSAGGNVGDSYYDGTETE